MKKNNITKLSLGQRTLIAILNCETQSQYERFRKIGMQVVKNFGVLADQYVVNNVKFHNFEISREEMDTYAEALGRAVDETRFDPFWSIVYRIALRRRGAKREAIHI